MTEESLVSEEMRKAIGTELNRFRIDIEKVLVRRLLGAIDDPNPRWNEVVPPSLFMTAFAQGGQVDLPFKLPVTRLLDGGGEWEFFGPVRLGDTITGARKVGSIRESKGKLGRMLFTTFETTWTNQRDEVVAKGRATLIWY